MIEEFQKPIAAPPLIFGVALLIGVCLSFVWAAPIAAAIFRIPIGAVGIGGEFA